MPRRCGARPFEIGAIEGGPDAGDHADRERRGEACAREAVGEGGDAGGDREHEPRRGDGERGEALGAAERAGQGERGDRGPERERQGNATSDEERGEADWLVIACPLTSETRGLIDAAALAALPKGARVINIARGAIVDEPALIRAIQSGHVGGAYLDVFQEEPLPSSSPLWDLPNVIVTPHDAAASRGNERRQYELFIENLKRLHRGEALVNEVRKAGA